MPDNIMSKPEHHHHSGFFTTNPAGTEIKHSLLVNLPNCRPMATFHIVSSIIICGLVFTVLHPTTTNYICLISFGFLTIRRTRIQPLKLASAASSITPLKCSLLVQCGAM